MKYNIAIIGLGYVGLPLADAFNKKYSVVGYDIDRERVEELDIGYDHTGELEKCQIEDALSNGLKFTHKLEDIKDSNIFIVTVPTPIDRDNSPDLEPLKQVSSDIGSLLKKGDIVIYESTVYPGVTEDICVPLLQKGTDLLYNKDFFVGYSPERINPGDKKHTVTKILKVTSGSTPKVADIIDELYRSIITAGTHKAPSIKVAEASKVIENTQRDVNIALINELAIIFNTMDINTNDVLEAASTKWNFNKFTPGLVGGHCIGVDPYYLTYRAEQLGYRPNLILGARQINNSMSKYIAEQTIKTMISEDQHIKGADILILGVTFKENCSDMRNSKVLDIIEELESYGSMVDVYDPYILAKNFNHKFNAIESPFDRNKRYNAILVAVAHHQFTKLTPNDYLSLSKNKPIVIDIKGIAEEASWSL